MGQFSATARRTSTWPNVAFGPWLQVQSGASTVTVRFENQTLDVGANGAVYGRLYQSPNADGSGAASTWPQTATFSAFGSAVSWNFDVTGLAAGTYVAGAFGSNTSGNTNSLDLTYFDDLSYCAYGTRIQPGQQLVTVISEATIALAAIAVPELAVFAVIFGAFVGWTFVPSTLCASPPPSVPQFYDSDFLFGGTVPAPGSIPKFWQALQAALWPLYCECVPATGVDPPAVHYPPPYWNPPPGGVAPPPGPIVCDNNDICSTLNSIIQQLRSLTAQVTWTRADVQLIQRQHVPFAYLRSTVHAGLTGQGSFAVQGILGLAVSLTTVPSSWGRSDDYPRRYIPAPASVTVGTADGVELVGWVNEPQLILDDGFSGAATLVTWHCKPGCVISITELVREP